MSDVLEVRKRQTTAQSSTLTYGYFDLQARVADSTRVRAAEARGANATIFTTSSFERTSHICQKVNLYKPMLNNLSHDNLSCALCEAEYSKSMTSIWIHMVFLFNPFSQSIRDLYSQLNFE